MSVMRKSKTKEQILKEIDFNSEVIFGINQPRSYYKEKIILFTEMVLKNKGVLNIHGHYTHNNKYNCFYLDIDEKHEIDNLKFDKIYSIFNNYYYYGEPRHLVLTSHGLKPNKEGDEIQTYSYHIIFRLFNFSNKTDYNLRDFEQTKELATMMKNVIPEVDISVYKKTGGFMRGIFAKKSPNDHWVFVIIIGMSDLRDIPEDLHVNFALGSIQLSGYGLIKRSISSNNNIEDVTFESIINLTKR
ncbi:hypothetical protein CDIK_3775 [Cucumispora dikerogammari]|nr:hypothetical protein CDIK_3775 [Cucumispora dikerogammari]